MEVLKNYTSMLVCLKGSATKKFQLQELSFDTTADEMLK